MENSELISRNILFADPQRSMVKISPNGQYLSFLAPHQGLLSVYIAPIHDLQSAKPISTTKEPVKEAWWSANGEYLLYSYDENGDENWQLDCYTLATKKVNTCTPKGKQARILKISSEKPKQILITLNLRDTRFMDVHCLDLESNSMQCVFENNQYWDFYADNQFNLRFAFKVKDKSGDLIDLRTNQVVTSFTLHDLFSLYFYNKLRLGFADKLNRVYVVHTLDSDTSQLMAIDIKAPYQQTAIAGKFKGDICDILMAADSLKPLAVAHNFERKIWHVVDESVAQDFAYLQTIDDGDMEIVSQTQDNQQWIVAFVHDDGPVSYYHYQRDKNHIQLLFESHDAWRKAHLNKMQTHVVRMRDGVQCVCYLSLPHAHTQPLPLVMMIHGGPNYRDTWGYNPVHQWLSNRGYAVLSINYRGSTGYGKGHFALGHGEWAGKMQLDIIDAAHWAIENKITTKDKVAIMGRSYGGYATLVGLSMTPDMFCCGVDVVGPSNLETMVKHFPPYWKAMQGAIHEMVGCDPNTPEGQSYLKERSPLYYADKITKPLLIGHGANDVRVMQAESDQMVAALKRNHIPVTYAVFTDEGHQFLHPENRMAFYALAELFFSKLLGGRYEPSPQKDNNTMILLENAL